MLKPNQKVAIYMQGFLHSDFGKMGLGVQKTPFARAEKSEKADVVCEIWLQVMV